MSEANGLKVRATHFDAGVAGNALRSHSAREIAEGDIARHVKRPRGLLWVDVVAEDKEAARRWLDETFEFHPLEIEDALSAEERPSLRVSEDSIFLVAPAVLLGQPREQFVEVAFFCFEHLLVTVATGEVGIVDHWFLRCRANGEAAGSGVAHLVHSLLDAIVDGYFPAVDALGEEIDLLEEIIYSGQAVNVGDALGMKRRLLELRRQIAPLRDILNGLLRRDVAFIKEDSRAYFQDVYEHTIRLTEVIDLERDIFAAVLDAHLSIVSNNLNVVMKRLTAISTVLMTGAFIAGIYGMNFRHMPELDWRFGYPLALGLMLLVGALELWFFWKSDWL